MLIAILPVLREPATAVEPCNGSLHDPALWFDDEALRVVTMPDDVDRQARHDVGGCILKHRARIGAIGEQLDGTVTVNRIPPVTIAPAAPGGDPAAPTGQVFNAFQADNAFMLSDGQPANFLFATEDGTISRSRHAVDHHRQRVDRPVGR